MHPPHVLLAVSGSIAAFKAASLAGTLIDSGIEVRALLTAGGSRFITPTTFAGITGHSVATSLWESTDESGPTQHLGLASWADVLVVAPASADAIARLAQGRSDDLLGAVALSFRGPLVVAPAMETHMFEHPATQANLDLLATRGARIVGPESGRLASGAVGTGRMSEPNVIAQLVVRLCTPIERSALAGRRILVTAGPTYEPVDPVRFIGNRSSGKMGYAVAREANRRGATVTLVSGPTALRAPEGIRPVYIETSDELRAAVLDVAADQDVIVMSAAVADFKPKHVSVGKIKRGSINHIELQATSDIAAAAVTAAPQAVHVGFALETGDLIAGATDKLRRKGQTLVVANALSAEHNPFGTDTNRVVLISRSGSRSLPEMRKDEVARHICDEIESLLDAGNQ